jgi:Tol biopolymer transport system component
MSVVRTVLAALALAVVLPTAADARIAYTKTDGIYVARDDGSGARRIVHASATLDGITPDGRKVIYSTSNGGQTFTQTLRVKTVDGATRTLLRQRTRIVFALAPDGHYAAALSGNPNSHSAGALKLLIIDLGNGSHRTVASGKTEDFDGASFSPDSKQLAYGHASSVYVAPVTGGAGKRILSNAAAPVWGPSLIAYAHLVTAGRYKHRNVWLANPAGTQPRALTHDTIGTYDDGIDPLGWSADGSRLLARYDGTDVYGIVVDTATGHEYRFPRNIGLELEAISKDGSTVLGFQGGVRGHPDTETVTRPATGGASKILAHKAGIAAWTL